MIANAQERPARKIIRARGSPAKETEGHRQFKQFTTPYTHHFAPILQCSSAHTQQLWWSNSRCSNRKKSWH